MGLYSPLLVFSVLKLWKRKNCFGSLINFIFITWKLSEEVKEFNKNYWTYIITSVNGLLVVNLSSLLGFEFFTKAAEVKIQQYLAFGYLLALLFIFFFWAQKKFNEDETMPVVIPQLSKSFFALLLAGLGVLLKGAADTM